MAAVVEVEVAVEAAVLDRLAQLLLALSLSARPLIVLKTRIVSKGRRTMLDVKVTDTRLSSRRTGRFTVVFDRSLVTSWKRITALIYLKIRH